MMTVGELRAMIEGLDDDTVVKLATQPSYPFTYDVAGVNLRSPKQGEIEEVEEFLADTDPLITADERMEAQAKLEQLRDEGQVLYILEGGNQEYASADLWSV